MIPIRKMWRAAPVATALLGLASVAIVVFCIRLTVGYIYWSDPAHRDQQIAGWMTPRYVAVSWDLPAEVVINAIRVPPGGGRAQNIAEMAKERGVPVEDLISALEAAIAAHRAAQ